MNLFLREPLVVVLFHVGIGRLRLPLSLLGAPLRPGFFESLAQPSEKGSGDPAEPAEKGK